MEFLLQPHEERRGAIVKALRLPIFIALVAGLATFPALATTLSSAPGAEKSAGLPNWTAPPYWTPRAEGAAATAGAGREALAGTSSPPLPFVAIAPCRVVDTRGYGFTGEYGPPSMAGGASRNFTIGGQCGIPASAVAVSFNFTVWNTSSYGDFNIYPTGGVRPTVSTLNWGPGRPGPRQRRRRPAGRERPDHGRQRERGHRRHLRRRQRVLLGRRSRDDAQHALGRL